MIDTKLTQRELHALELSISIAFDGALRPRAASQAQMVRDDAKAALAKLKASRHE